MAVGAEVGHAAELEGGSAQGEDELPGEGNQGAAPVGSREGVRAPPTARPSQVCHGGQGARGALTPPHLLRRRGHRAPHRRAGECAGAAAQAKESGRRPCRAGA